MSACCRGYKRRGNYSEFPNSLNRRRQNVSIRLSKTRCIMQSMDIHLSEQEMKQLNRMVTSYLDFAEDMAGRKIPLTMADWEERLNTFIEMFEYGLLKDAGKVSAEIAKLHAETEFEKYRIIQDKLFMSDFDRFILELESKQ